MTAPSFNVPDMKALQPTLPVKLPFMRSKALLAEQKVRSVSLVEMPTLPHWVFKKDSEKEKVEEDEELPEEEDETNLQRFERISRDVHQSLDNEEELLQEEYDTQIRRSNSF
jgi:hypothetical protein